MRRIGRYPKLLTNMPAGHSMGRSGLKVDKCCRCPYLAFISRSELRTLKQTTERAAVQMPTVRDHSAVATRYDFDMASTVWRVGVDAAKCR